MPKELTMEGISKSQDQSPLSVVFIEDSESETEKEILRHVLTESLNQAFQRWLWQIYAMYTSPQCSLTVKAGKINKYEEYLLRLGGNMFLLTACGVWADLIFRQQNLSGYDLVTKVLSGLSSDHIFVTREMWCLKEKCGASLVQH